MSKHWSYPDVANLRRPKGESTTSANVGVYEKPLGAPMPRVPTPSMPGSADAIPLPSDGWFDADEYLRKLGLR